MSNQSLKVPRSDSKEMGEKRDYAEIDERLDLGSKKPKIRDLDCVFRSEDRIGTEALTDTAARAPDLNANVGPNRNVVGNDMSACLKETHRVTAFGRQEMECDAESSKSRGIGLDLNAEDLSSSINHEPFSPIKNLEQLKSRDESECASSIGPLEEKDPMKVWNEMKQNGFLSSLHGGLPMPKPRARKTKTDGLKKKMEIAKREQVDRFAKIAAPSGLLNGLNPGIINHVRNSKQVHSIIESLVKSEKLKNDQAGSKPGTQTKCRTKEFSEKKSVSENMLDSGVNRSSHEPGSLTAYAGGRQMGGHLESMNKVVSLKPELRGRNADLCTTEPRVCEGINYPQHFNPCFEDDVLELKLSSSSKIASGNISSLSTEESANLTSVSLLSVKAANVASQWLELLNQDIKGRITALRRSKKRVRDVIHTDLPYLASREFPVAQENNPYMEKSSVSHSDCAIAEAHRVRWGALFHQMDKALSEEESQLESWLKQVKEMQMHCERGLFKYNATNGFPLVDREDNTCRLEEADSQDRDLAVRAAAASIYSTCNFLSSMENQPCC